jgi:hypothetical protein
MKTTKFFSALSLALVIFAATSAFAGGIDKKDGQIALTNVVKHHVNINLNLDRKICNVYLVEILNEKGQLAAPAKTYVPGVTSYDFYERGPATGVRIAVLVLAPVYSHFSCDTELFTQPSLVKGPFDAGTTYRYDLYPQTSSPRE